MVVILPALVILVRLPVPVTAQLVLEERIAVVPAGHVLIYVLIV